MRGNLNFFLNRFYMLKDNNSSMALDGGSIKEDGYSQWFLSLRTVASALEKPLLAG